MEDEKLFVITDNGAKKSLGEHVQDEWGSCSLGPVLRRGDDFFLVRENGEEVHLCTQKCAGWQGGVGCLYFVSHYNDFILFPITV